MSVLVLRTTQTSFSSVTGAILAPPPLSYRRGDITHTDALQLSCAPALLGLVSAEPWLELHQKKRASQDLSRGRTVSPRQGNTTRTGAAHVVLKQETEERDQDMYERIQ
ncbi:hypothetical protein NDU88_004205 [Pleurodeles waltl]|uniref:Uncharacterized protein n=1 Tax=Pleurodeles waltl TaxID=8319 RepID=A0AAV7KX36_PLEWA|nr:hypothetical protein NDU88_004205 [Pleurodeles waltl]